MNAPDVSLKAFFLPALAVLTGLTALTILLSIVLLDPPVGDLAQLAIFLPLSGAVSLAVCAFIPRLLRIRRLQSLQGKILTGIVLAAGLILVNLGFTAYLMFLSSHDLKLLLVLMVFSFGISAFFALIVARAFDSTLKTLLDGVRTIGEGKLETRIDINSGDEIEDISHAFNLMVAKLGEAFGRQSDLEEARRNLIAAVSHDLRSPLASMRAMVESISDGVVTEPETVQRYLRTMQGEIGYLSRLIDDLFELSQIDSGLLELKLEQSSISDLVSDTLEALRPQAEQRHLRLDGDVDGFLPDVVMDVSRMQRVLYNLAQNALRHTPPDGSICIRAVDTGSEVVISVEDTGEGMDAADLAHIFDRFYRGSKARTRDEAGSGLGLTIAKGIVELHGGQIWAQSQRDRGATFAFTVPKAPAVPPI